MVDRARGTGQLTLTKDMTDLIEAYTIGCVATVRLDGTPAVSPKATFLVVNERLIVFANIRSPGTVENIRHRPDVEVNFVDGFTRKSCRVRGLARYVLSDNAEVALKTSFKEKWPDLYGLIQGFVVIDVTGAQMISSPSYDAGAVSSQLAEQWLRTYAVNLGYDVVRRGSTGP